MDGRIHGEDAHSWGSVNFYQCLKAACAKCTYPKVHEKVHKPQLLFGVFVLVCVWARVSLGESLIHRAPVVG